MNSRENPGRELSLSQFATNAHERHEELVDLFGRYVMWLRNRTVEAVRALAESEEARAHLGTIRRKPYDGVGSMSPEEREAALRFSGAAVDEFIKLLLGVLAHRGIDFELGDRHAIRYRLEMEVVDVDDRETILSEVINRDGAKHFADYWGRWLNRHQDK